MQLPRLCRAHDPLAPCPPPKLKLRARLCLLIRYSPAAVQGKQRPHNNNRRPCATDGPVRPARTPPPEPRQLRHLSNAQPPRGHDTTKQARQYGTCSIHVLRDNNRKHHVLCYGQHQATCMTLEPSTPAKNVPSYSESEPQWSDAHSAARFKPLLLQRLQWIPVAWKTQQVPQTILHVNE